MKLKGANGNAANLNLHKYTLHYRYTLAGRAPAVHATNTPHHHYYAEAFKLPSHACYCYWSTHTLSSAGPHHLPHCGRMATYGILIGFEPYCNMSCTWHAFASGSFAFLRWEGINGSTITIAVAITTRVLIVTLIVTSSQHAVASEPTKHVKPSNPGA